MKVWRAILVLTLVFGAGAAAGVFGARWVARQEAHQAALHPERSQQQLERVLARRLDLNTDQQAKMHDIVSRSRQELETIYQQVQPQTASVRRAMDGEIMQILTPEQRELYRHFKQQNHPFWRPGPASRPARPPAPKPGPDSD